MGFRSLLYLVTFVGLFFTALPNGSPQQQQQQQQQRETVAPLEGGSGDDGRDDAPLIAYRRLSHRHARDEISWPEGKLLHSKEDRLRLEERKAREELHRLEYYESKKNPTLQAAAQRVGNSKKDRQKLSQNTMMLEQLHRAAEREEKERKEEAEGAQQSGRRHKIRLHKEGFGAFFPEVGLDANRAAFSLERTSVKPKPKGRKRQENQMIARKRKAAALKLGGGENSDGRGGNNGRSSGGGGGGGGAGGGQITEPLGPNAKPLRRKRRAEFLERQAAAAAAASATPLAQKVRSVAAARRGERVARAASMEEDLESTVNLLLSSGASGDGGGGAGSSGGGGNSSSSSVGRSILQGKRKKYALKWLKKLPAGVKRNWGQPLVTLHMWVDDDDGEDDDNEAGPDEDHGDGNHDTSGGSGVSSSPALLRRWLRVEAKLRRLLLALAASEYATDVVDLHLHLVANTATSTAAAAGASTGGGADGSDGGSSSSSSSSGGGGGGSGGQSSSADDDDGDGDQWCSGSVNGEGGNGDGESRAPWCGCAAVMRSFGWAFGRKTFSTHRYHFVVGGEEQSGKGDGGQIRGGGGGGDEQEEAAREGRRGKIEGDRERLAMLGRKLLGLFLGGWKPADEDEVGVFLHATDEISPWFYLYTKTAALTYRGEDASAGQRFASTAYEGAQNKEANGSTASMNGGGGGSRLPVQQDEEEGGGRAGRTVRVRGSALLAAINLQAAAPWASETTAAAATAANHSLRYFLHQAGGTGDDQDEEDKATPTTPPPTTTTRESGATAASRASHHQQHHQHHQHVFRGGGNEGPMAFFADSWVELGRHASLRVAWCSGDQRMGVRVLSSRSERRSRGGTSGRGGLGGSGGRDGEDDSGGKGGDGNGGYESGGGGASGGGCGVFDLTWQRLFLEVSVGRNYQTLCYAPASFPTDKSPGGAMAVRHHNSHKDNRRQSTPRNPGNSYRSGRDDSLLNTVPPSSQLLPALLSALLFPSSPPSPSSQHLPRSSSSSSSSSSSTFSSSSSSSSSSSVPGGGGGSVAAPSGALLLSKWPSKDVAKATTAETSLLLPRAAELTQFDAFGRKLVPAVYASSSSPLSAPSSSVASISSGGVSSAISENGRASGDQLEEVLAAAPFEAATAQWFALPTPLSRPHAGDAERVSAADFLAAQPRSQIAIATASNTRNNKISENGNGEVEVSPLSLARVCGVDAPGLTSQKAATHVGGSLLPQMSFRAVSKCLNRLRFQGERTHPFALQQQPREQRHQDPLADIPEIAGASSVATVSFSPSKDLDITEKSIQEQIAKWEQKWQPGQ